MLFDFLEPDAVDKCSKIKISLFLTEKHGKIFLYNAQTLHQSFETIVWSDWMLRYNLQALH